MGHGALGDTWRGAVQALESAADGKSRLIDRGTYWYRYLNTRGLALGEGA